MKILALWNHSRLRTVTVTHVRIPIGTTTMLASSGCRSALFNNINSFLTLNSVNIYSTHLNVPFFVMSCLNCPKLMFLPGKLVRYGIGSSPRKYVTVVLSFLCPLLFPLPWLLTLSLWTSLADSLMNWDADDGSDEITDGTWFRDTDDAESDKVQFPDVVLRAVSA